VEFDLDAAIDVMVDGERLRLHLTRRSDVRIGVNGREYKKIMSNCRRERRRGTGTAETPVNWGPASVFATLRVAAFGAVYYLGAPAPA